MNPLAYSFKLGVHHSVFDCVDSTRQRECVLLSAAKPDGVSLGGAATSADLGGSSKYSNENFED